MNKIKRYTSWSPATFVLGLCIVLLLMSAIVWSQGQNFPGGSTSTTLSGAAPAQGHINAAKTCPDSTQLNVTCFVVAADVVITSDCTWSTSGSTVTCPSTDPVFKSTGSIYPATCSGPSTTCDVGKAEFGTYNCLSISPGDCFAAITQGTITGITSAHVATVSIAATHGSGATNNFFAWGTNDNTALAAANDACMISTVPCDLQLPCANMFFDHSVFTSVRVTRGPNSIGYVGCEGNGTVMVPLPSFICTLAGGCYMNLNRTCGQAEFQWSCIDSARNIRFFGLGLDVNPGTSNYPGSPIALVGATTGTNMTNIGVDGALWNVSTGFIIYGHQCLGCNWTNNTSYAGGNFNCHFQIGTAIGVGGSIQGGFCDSSAGPACVMDLGVVVSHGLQCNTVLGANGGGNTNTFLGASVQVNAGTWASYGDYTSGAVWLTGTGQLVAHGSTFAHQGQTTDGINLGAAANNAYLCNDTFLSGMTHWVTTTAAANVYDECPNTFGTAITTASLGSGGRVIGSASETTTAITAAALVLSAGWGNGPATWSALSGNTKLVQGTITNTGAAQSASPTITYTFPSPFADATNLVCRAYQIGGTQAILAATEFLTPSSQSATGVTFTYNGTPSTGLTEVMQIDCDSR